MGKSVITCAFAFLSILEWFWWRASSDGPGDGLRALQLTKGPRDKGRKMADEVARIGNAFSAKTRFDFVVSPEFMEWRFQGIRLEMASNSRFRTISLRCLATRMLMQLSWAVCPV